jgi:hypothetical protein
MKFIVRKLDFKIKVNKQTKIIKMSKVKLGINGLEELEELYLENLSTEIM